MKKFLIIIFIIFIIIVLGLFLYNLKEKNEVINNSFIITQFQPQVTSSMGYMIETGKNKIIMIDGGLPGDSEMVQEKLLEKGGNVDAWFITHAHKDHLGALIEIIKSNKINIKQIYVSFNDYSWYEKYDTERYQGIKEMLDVLYSDEIKEKLYEVSLKEEIHIDNLNFKILKIKNPKYTKNAGNNQSMVIKVSNNIKSVIFLGDLGEEYEDEFLENNIDEIKADGVQMAHHGQAGVSDKVYNAINPEICFWPTPRWLWTNDPGDGSVGPWKTLETRAWIEKIGAKNYVAKDGIFTVKIY